MPLGKFDTLATSTYAKAPIDGPSDDAAKERGMVAAIMGAKSRLGIRHKHGDDHEARKEPAERKKKTAITASSFDHQVAEKMDAFFEGLPPDHEEARAGGSVL